jgi:hypothetical protein
MVRKAKTKRSRVTRLTPKEISVIREARALIQTEEKFCKDGIAAYEDGMTCRFADPEAKKFDSLGALARASLPEVNQESALAFMRARELQDKISPDITLWEISRKDGYPAVIKIFDRILAA